MIYLIYYFFIYKERCEIFEFIRHKGKKAIVIGVSKGLGYGIAEGFLEQWCEVVIIGSSDAV